MSNYVIAVYVSFWSWHAHGSHSVCLPKPGVTWLVDSNSEQKPQEVSPNPISFDQILFSQQHIVFKQPHENFNFRRNFPFPNMFHVGVVRNISKIIIKSFHIKLLIFLISKKHNLLILENKKQRFSRIFSQLLLSSSLNHLLKSSWPSLFRKVLTRIFLSLQMSYKSGSDWWKHVTPKRGVN
jgi:hypothetical protein